MPDPACGYASAHYAQSLGEFGEPISLGRSGTWLLKAEIPNTRYSDVFGPYPLFAAERPELLARDFAGLPNDLVSLYVVSDPLREEQLPAYELAFDFVRPYKTHYLVDLSIAFGSHLRRHHRRYAKRALEHIQVIKGDCPASFAVEWDRLYSLLCERHSITGLRRFSLRSFCAQLSVPGSHYFRALHGDEVVGGFICYLDRGRAYAHLISTTHMGQQLLAQYALYWTAIEYFRGCAKTFDLGGVPGALKPEHADVAFFKSGWSTSSRTACFCGRVLNRQVYNELTNAAGPSGGGYFPAYRSGILGAG